MSMYVVVHEGRDEGTTFYVMKADDPWDAIERVKQLEENHEPPIPRETWKTRGIATISDDLDSTEWDWFRARPRGSKPEIKYGPWKLAK